jgi:hypothetical protein
MTKDTPSETQMAEVSRRIERIWLTFKWQARVWLACDENIVSLIDWPEVQRRKIYCYAGFPPSVIQRWLLAGVKRGSQFVWQASGPSQPSHKALLSMRRAQSEHRPQQEATSSDLLSSSIVRTPLFTDSRICMSVTELHTHTYMISAQITVDNN